MRAACEGLWYFLRLVAEFFTQNYKLEVEGMGLHGVSTLLMVITRIFALTIARKRGGGGFVVARGWI